MAAGNAQHSSTSAPSALSPLRFVVRRSLACDRDAIVRYLERDPAPNLYALAWLERTEGALRPSGPTGSYVLLADESRPRGAGNLLGVCLVVQDRMVVPACQTPQVARAFGYKLQFGQAELEHIVGGRSDVAWLWDAYSDGRRPRLDRPQRYYVLDRPPAPTGLAPAPVHRATARDLEDLIEASAEMYREETLSDPMELAPMGFRRMIASRVDQGRMYLWRDRDGRLLFKADISTSYSGGAMLSGVWTRPDARGRGVATRSLATLCDRLLTGYPAIVLYVNEHNTSAVGLYQRLGFRYHCPYRTIFVE